jgi:acetolactate synthase regulatory subunit
VFVAWQDQPVRDEWYARSSVVSPDQVAVLERILEATARRGYVVTVHSNPRDKMAEIMRAVSSERTIRDVRRTLQEQLAQLPPVAYLVNEETLRGKLAVESIQAPIFDPGGLARYALTVGNIDLELDADTAGRFGAEVRGAADEFTAALRAHSRHRRVRAGRKGEG